MKFRSRKFANLEEWANARFPKGKENWASVKAVNMDKVCTAK